jgi:four helix bundle protein
VTAAEAHPLNRHDARATYEERGASIRDAKLRDEALRSAKSACLNTAEGAARVTRADKARAFGVARAEGIEAVASVEVAATSGDVRAEAVPEVLRCPPCSQRTAAARMRLLRRLPHCAARPYQRFRPLQRFGLAAAMFDWYWHGRVREQARTSLTQVKEHGAAYFRRGASPHR